MVGKIEGFPANLEGGPLADAEGARKRHVQLDQAQAYNDTVRRVSVGSQRRNGKCRRVEPVNGGISVGRALVAGIRVGEDLIHGLVRHRGERAVRPGRDREPLAAVDLKNRSNLPIAQQPPGPGVAEPGRGQVAAFTRHHAAKHEQVTKLVEIGEMGDGVTQVRADGFVDPAGAPIALGHQLLDLFQLGGQRHVRRQIDARWREQAS